MKTVRITFPNGHVFEVGAGYVARHRALHYAQLDFDSGEVDNLEKAIENETQFALKDDYELTDWLSNNMNWKDVEPFASRVTTEEKPDYAKWFTNAEKEVLSRDG